MLPPLRMTWVRPEFPDDPNEFQRVGVDGEGSGVEEDVAIRAEAEDVVGLVRAVNESSHGRRSQLSGRRPSAADDQTVRDSENDLGHGLLTVACLPGHSP